MAELNRWAEETVMRRLKVRRIILLGGARQTGKTTLARACMKRSGVYRTLDDEAVLQMAEASPKTFVSHGAETLSVDEIQMCDRLLSAIKLAIGVKSGEALPSDFRHIRWFRDHIFRGREFIGIVLHADDQTYQTEDGCYLVPMPALWQKKK